MPPLHRVRARRPSAVGERYQENAFTGRSVLPDAESQIVRDLTKRIDKLEGDVGALKTRLVGVEKRLDAIEARPAPEPAVVTVTAQDPLAPETVEALQAMATKAVEKVRADAAAKSASADDLSKVAEAARLLDDQIQQLRAVLALMQDHAPRLQRIETALSVYGAAAKAVAEPGGPR